MAEGSSWRSAALISAGLAAGCGPRGGTPPRPAPLPEPAAVRSERHGFPRLALQLQLCCPDRATVGALEQAGDWDLIVVDAELVGALPAYLGPAGRIRERNPDAVVVAYFSGGDVNPHNPRPLTSAFYAGVHPEWMLRDVGGDQVPLFHLGGERWTYALDPASAVNAALPAYLHERVVGTGLVDGVFYDWANTSVSWLNHRRPPLGGAIDLDGDGRRESDAEVDRRWVDGFRTLLVNSRAAFPTASVILGNAGWNSAPAYDRHLNGVMIERFMAGAAVDEERFGWGALMRTYAHYQTRAPGPRLSLVMANDDDPGAVAAMRFALASTLMFDGYFAFTNESGAYRDIRWYDEYAVDLASGRAVRSRAARGYLGRPLGPAREVGGAGERLLDALERDPAGAARRVWRRDFEHGVVLVNPGPDVRPVDPGPGLGRIRGTVDPAFNDGSRVDSLRLGPRSGAVLLRRTSASGR